jgi:hypothetical protein
MLVNPKSRHMRTAIEAAVSGFIQEDFLELFHS